ncbi:MAG TPA: radical SAM protein [Candidatus Limnocylindria bacterium]|nr:radical SAM protein [Candidatus Limnocylindria bacterium]
MFAVHADRSGRVVVANDRTAAGWNGLRDVPLEPVVPLPEGSELVPLPRDACAFDRGGRVRPLAAGRLALGALLPPGYLRALHPSYVDTDALAPLEPRSYAAVGADDRGALHVAAVRYPERVPAVAAEADARPGSDRASRQAVRCARANSCLEARAVLGHRGVGALPFAAPVAERPDAALAMAGPCSARVRERASIEASAEEIAALALAHLRGGGSAVAFGRSCDGEPLASARTIESAVARVREGLPQAHVSVETLGTSASKLTRLARAGVADVTVRLASARRDTHERIHRPVGWGFADLRASISAAREAGLRLSLAVLVLPGLTDRPSELDAIAELAQDAGARVELRDLGADPQRALALVRTGEAPLGIGVLVARLAGAE